MARVLRSQATRDRILHEARRLFGEQGYERTTIRSVAAAAAISPSMVIRYYRSKEGLFAAAAEIDLRIPDLSTAPPEALGVLLVANFLDRWESADADDQLQALLRAAVSHEGARARLIDTLTSQFSRVIVAFCPSETQASCVGLISTQFSGLAFARYVLRLPHVVSLDRALIVERIGAVVQDHLDQAMAGRG